MGLASPESAILSALIFNALIIPLLVPLARRGLAYRPQSAAWQLVRNLGLYGAGGLIVPFAGIKLPRSRRVRPRPRLRKGHAMIRFAYALGLVIFAAPIGTVTRLFKD